MEKMQKMKSQLFQIGFNFLFTSQQTSFKGFLPLTLLQVLVLFVLYGGTFARILSFGAPFTCPPIRNYYNHPYRYYLENICRYAVERSCGHLENVHVECFPSNNLLRFIARNANNLRCTWLESCGRITDKGLSKAARKIPLLEELDVSNCRISKVSLEAVGRSCPLLKSFKFADFDSCGFEDLEAFVIAETMCGLRHRDIEGNDITDVGLTAILDGCPLLESLNIQKCIYLDLSGNLRERCLQQIKDIRLPIQHSSEDYNYEDSYSYSYSPFDDNDFDPFD